MDIFNYKIAEVIDRHIEDDSIILKLLVDRNPVTWNTEEIEVPLQVCEENLKYEIGTLVKFSDYKPQTFEAIPTDDFDYIEFNAIEKRMPLMSGDELIAIHQKIKNKYATDDIHNGLSFYEHFIFRILDLDLVNIISKEENPGLFEFYNSKYMSDYLKQEIREKVTNPSEELLEIIDSDKGFTEFTEEEFSEIFKSVQFLKDGDDRKHYLGWALMALAFKLDTDGAKGFLNNQVNPRAVVKRIARMSGFEQVEYYCCRNDNSFDLNGKKLKTVYDYLERLDEDKAISMAKMTMKMEKLCACNFLVALHNLAEAEFNLDEAAVSNDDVSVAEVGQINLKELLSIDGITNLFSPPVDITDSIKAEFRSLLPEDIVLAVCVSEEKSCGSAFFKPSFRKK